MNKQTWKFRGMAAATAAAVATAPSIAAAARRAGVNRSTLYRWAKAEKIPALTPRRRRRPVAAHHPSSGTRPAVDLPQSPENWRAQVDATFEFDATEAALADLAAMALLMAHDLTQPTSIRLQAATRFSALVRQLNLEAEVDHGETASPSRAPSWPRPVVLK